MHLCFVVSFLIEKLYEYYQLNTYTRVQASVLYEYGKYSLSHLKNS